MFALIPKELPPPRSKRQGPRDTTVGTISVLTLKRAWQRALSQPIRDDSSHALCVFSVLIPIGIVLVSIWTGTDSHVARFAMPSMLWASENPVPGYNMIWNGEFINLESIYFFTQSEALQGLKYHHTAGFTDRRIFYAFLGLPFRPFLSDQGMFQAVNVLLFAATGTCLYLFSARLFQHGLSAILALVLYVLSMPVAATIGSYSAHIGAMFFTYLWAYLMLRYLVDEEHIETRRIVGLSCILGLWALTYGSWMAGLGILVALLIWRRRLLHAAIPIFVGFAAGKAQIWVMELAGFGTIQDMVQTNLTVSLNFHIESFLNHRQEYLLSALNFLYDVIFVDNPVVFLLGAVSLLFLKVRAKPLLWLLLAVPILALFVYQPVGAIRGYAIPGITIVTLVLAGRLLAKPFDILSRPELRYAVAVLVGCVFISQAAWSNAARLGAQLPTVTYFSGPTHSCAPLTFTPTQYLNVAGEPNDVPRLFGGTTSLEEFVGPSQDRPRVVHRAEIQSIGRWFKSWVTSKPRALIVQAPIWILILGIVWCFLGPPTRRSASLFLLLAMIALVFLPMRHRVLDFSDRIDVWGGAPLKKGDRIEGALTFSPEFIAALSSFQAKQSNVQIFVQHTGLGGNCLTFHVLGRSAKPDAPWSWGDPHAGTFVEIPIQELVRKLNTNDRQMQFAISYDRDICSTASANVGTWQQNGPDRGRTAHIVRSDGKIEELDRFPSVEVRVFRPDQRPKKGFGPFAELTEKLRCVAAVGF